MKILIVEDFGELRAMLATFLRRQGHEIAEASNGSEAIELAASFEPDLAILDYRLPDLDGVETARRIRERCPSVRPVICSAADPNHFEARHELEPNGLSYIDKAQLPAALLTVLDSHQQA